MVDDPGDLLRVALEDRNHLLGVLVEDGSVAIVASGQQLAVIRGVDVQGQDAGHAGRVEARVGGEREEGADLVGLQEPLGHGAAAALALLREGGGAVLQPRHHLRGHAHRRQPTAGRDTASASLRLTNTISIKHIVKVKINPVYCWIRPRYSDHKLFIPRHHFIIYNLF